MNGYVSNINNHLGYANNSEIRLGKEDFRIIIQSGHEL